MKDYCYYIPALDIIHIEKSDGDHPFCFIRWSDYELFYFVVLGEL